MGVSNLAAMLVDLVSGATPPPTYEFPKDADLLAELTTTATNWPVVIKKHLDDFVVPRYGAIPVTLVSPKRGAAKVVWNTDVQIEKVVRDQSTVPKVIPVTNTLPGSEPGRFDFKLHQLQPNPGNDIANGFSLVRAYLPGGIVPASAHTSQVVAKQSLKNLAAFEGFCVRLASAISAADRAGVSLAEALALWRTEGDLLVPYSQKRFAARAPTCDVIPGISLGSNTDKVFFSMIRGLWSYPFKDIFTALPVGPAAQAAAKDVFRVIAFVHWTLIAAGLDFFWQRVAVDISDKTTTVNRLATLLNEHHQARGGANDVAGRRAECNDVLNDLECTLPSDIDERAFVAPNDPAKLISLILGEALLFADLDTVAGKGPLIPPTPKLKYLAYHTQDRRHDTDPEQDKFTLMLVSATVAAAHDTKDSPLRASLRAAPIELEKTPKESLKPLDFNVPGSIVGDKSGHIAVYDKLKAAGWLAVPANLEALAVFMLEASATLWSGWQALRGNMARYAKLLAYYEALLG